MAVVAMALPLLVPSLALLGDVFIWEGSAGDGNWHNAENWYGNEVPEAGDTAILDIDSRIILTADAVVAVYVQSNGILNGSGTLTVQNQMTWTGGTMSGTGVGGAGVTTVEGGLMMNGDSLRLKDGRTLNLPVGATATLTEHNAQIELSTGGRINNAGTFLALNNKGLFSFSAYDLFTNTGLFIRGVSFQPTGDFTVSVPFANSGTVRIEAGELTLSGSDGGATSGDFFLRGGTVLDFRSNFNLSASAEISGEGTATLAGGVITVGGSFALPGVEVSGGRVNFDGPTSVSTMTISSGELGGSGPINVSGALTLSGGTLGGSGTIDVSGLMTWTAGTMSGTGVGGTGVTNANGGLLMNGDYLRLRDGRTLNLPAGATATLSGDSAQIELITGGRFNNHGTFLALNDKGLFSSSAYDLFTNTGLFIRGVPFQPTGDFTVSVPFANSGAVNVQTGTLRVQESFTQSAGTTLLNGGNLAGGITFNFLGGQLSGAGTITGNLSNTGAMVHPGGSGAAGVITVTGNYMQGASGTLAIELGGTTAGTQHDQLAIGGTATLNGALNLAFISGFTPSSGQQFNVLTYQTRSGAFASFTGESAGFTQDYQPAGLVLTSNVTGSVKNDFNSDGKPDLVWQNDATGSIGVWLMDGTDFVSAQLFNPDPVTDTNWKIAGTGDFNADSKPDLVWQHNISGSIRVWLMDGVNQISSVLFNPGQVTDLNWKIVGVSDSNNDAKPDLVWQNNATGAVGVWLMDGTNLISAPLFNPSPITDTNWKIVGSGDFNNDSKPDLVWQHNTSGSIEVWLMDGLNVISAPPFSPGQVPDTNWKIVGSGDFNNDAKSDLLWQHITDGHIGTWLMDGTTLLSEAFFNPSPVNPNWSIRNR